MARDPADDFDIGAADTPTLHLKLTNDTDAITTTFKQWRECVNGEIGSNMQKIDTFAGNTNEALNNKVDKETGKGLSTNDFTDNDKAKVDAIPANPKYTDTTYTAGEGIAISDTNVISATSISPHASTHAVGGTDALFAAPSVSLSTTWTTATTDTTPSTSFCSYYQEISATGVKANNIVIVGLAPSANATQREAAVAAQLFAFSQSNGKVVICVAKGGKKPTVAIPLQIVTIG